MWSRVIAVTLAIASAAAGSAAEPFSFRGLTLGTSLADLRRMRYPEAASARVLCSHDPEAREIRPTFDFVAQDTEIKAEVRSCGVFTFGRVLGASSAGLPAEWIPATIKVGSVDVRPTFWIVPGAAGAIESEGRLYRIAMRTNTDRWEEVKAAFLRRYGKPSSVEKGTFATARKLSVDNETVTWRNADSMIRLVKRATTPSRMMIVFQHTALTPGGNGAEQRDGTALPGGFDRRPAAQPDWQGKQKS